MNTVTKSSNAVTTSGLNSLALSETPVVGTRAHIQKKLVRLLRVAYSSEMGAALAYRGHAEAVSDAFEKEMLRRIEAEEWLHRTAVGRILQELGSRPSEFREALFSLVGNLLLRLAPYSGWYMPMFVAGKMEAMNVGEYTRMQSWASQLGLHSMADEFQQMAVVERAHQAFFQERLRSRARH